MREQRLLDRAYDPKLEVGEHTRLALEQQEQRRLAELGLMATVAGSIPRRLGQDATSEELAADKKTARRVGYIALKCEKMWVKKKLKVDVTDEIRIAGAQIDWNSWWQLHQEFLSVRIAYLSTWALRNHEVRWGNHAVTNLQSELKWLRMILS